MIPPQGVELRGTIQHPTCIPIGKFVKLYENGLVKFLLIMLDCLASCLMRNTKKCSHNKFKSPFSQWVTLNLKVLFNLGPVDQQGVEVAGKPIRERRRQEGEKGERE